MRNIDMDCPVSSRFRRLLVTGLAGLLASWSAVATAAPTVRRTVDQRGDLVLIGNTLGHDCGPDTNQPLVVGTVQGCPANSANDGIDVVWRSDAPAAGQALADGATQETDARSRAVLSLPAGARVTYARLYWAGTLTGNNNAGDADLNVTLSVGTASLAVAGEANGFVGNYTGNLDAYQASAEVTAFVQAQGAGSYTVSGVTLGELVGGNLDAFGSWTLAVLYERDSDPVRRLTLLDGLDLVDNANPVFVTSTDFVYPAGAAGNADVWVAAYEGDRTSVGDSLSYRRRPAAGPIPSFTLLLDTAGGEFTNFFNGSHYLEGVATSVAGDLPQTTGAAGSHSGYDLDKVDVSSFLQAGDTSGELRFFSLDEFYLVGVTGFSVTTTAAVGGDEDLDDDGVLNADEPNATQDTDGDGLINQLDPDSDDDGLFDGTELGITTPDADTDVTQGNFVADADPASTTDPLLEDTDTGGELDGSEDVNLNGRVDAGERNPANPADDTGPLTDSDADGILNSDEGLGDADNDGTPNAADTDSDNDTILDSVEAGDTSLTTPPRDTDSDGTPDFLDVDSDADTISDAMEGTADLDSDSLPMFRDTDSDGDTLLDSVEAGDTSLVTAPVDTDGDGLGNFADTDSDNDTIRDAEEGTADPDLDTVPSYLDPDSDGDGLPDSVEAGDSELSTPASNTDGDSAPDFLDTDSDNDTVLDRTESVEDSDADTVPNFRDTDSDGDTRTDASEAGDTDLNTPPVDTDGDGKPDILDPDSDADTIPDVVDNCRTTANTNQSDADKDGIGNRCDPTSGDIDDDNIKDADDGAGDADGDGIPNNADTDSDDDGILDAIEAGDDDVATPPVDTDKDGKPDFIDTDSDNDGVPDSKERGEGAPGSLPVDTDNDGAPDYVDVDSDNDGTSDADSACSPASVDGAPDKDADDKRDVCDDFDDRDKDGDGFIDGKVGVGGGGGGGCSVAGGVGGALPVGGVFGLLLLLGMTARRRQNAYTR